MLNGTYRSQEDESQGRVQWNLKISKGDTRSFPLVILTVVINKHMRSLLTYTVFNLRQDNLTKNGSNLRLELRFNLDYLETFIFDLMCWNNHPVWAIYIVKIVVS